MFKKYNVELSVVGVSVHTGLQQAFWHVYILVVIPFNL